jgi:hypothetical protein
VNELEGWLLEGHSLNIVGLPGSGRTAELLEIESMLQADPGVWSTSRWTHSDVLALSDSELLDELRKLKAPDAIPVLLIDDFGELLVTSRGKKLEQRLFTMINDPDPDAETLRCVLVTTPRDRNIEVPGSGLRERCKAVSPRRWRIAPEVAGRFGCSDDQQLLEFCGGTHLLAPARPGDPDSERGIAMQRARSAAVTWVGQLRDEHQRRLGDILSRPPAAPSTWRTGGIDEALVPMLVSSSEGKCHIVEALRNADLPVLLSSEQWPSKDLASSVRRFAARCANEPRPRWIDNFLSDTNWLDAGRLARFLSGVLEALDGRPLEILSRRQVGDATVEPADLAADLRSAGITPDQESLLDWRLYDVQGGNLHDRQLLLPGRTEAFKLPPATVIVGQARAGNESDAELPVRNHDAVRAAWSSASRIW